MIFQSLISFLLAVCFSFGLFISGLLDPQVLISLFEINPINARVPLTGLAMIATYLVLFHFIKERKRPVFSKAWSVPRTRTSSLKFVMGCSLYGVGLSFGGYTPATALTNLFVQSMEPLGFLMMLVAGLIMGGLIFNKAH
ncbi:hypothetical protein GW916_05585 [bacterium]|nr:hypothetical protein [bacterium]